MLINIKDLLRNYTVPHNGNSIPFAVKLLKRLQEFGYH